MDFFQEFKLNAIIDIIDFLKPTIIYESLGSVAMVYISFGIPIFLTFALFSRYLEESAKAMAGEAKFIVAVKDTLVTCVFLCGYAAIGIILVKLISVIGEKFYEYGSFAVICEDYADTIETVTTLTKEYEKLELFDFFRKSLRSISSIAGWLFFYATIILFIFVYAFLRLAYCLLYCLAYLWGFVALPLMLSKRMDLSTGWIKTLLSLLAWPIIEASFYGLVSPLFKQFSTTMIATYSGKAGVIVLAGYVYLLLGIINLILVAISVAAVFVSFFLVMNQSAALGVAAPFIATAAAGAGMFQNIARNIQKASISNMARQGSKAMDNTVAGATRFVSGAAGAVANTAGAIAGAGNAMVDRFRGGGSSGGSIDSLPGKSDTPSGGSSMQPSLSSDASKASAPGSDAGLTPASPVHNAGDSAIGSGAQQQAATSDNAQQQNKVPQADDKGKSTAQGADNSRTVAGLDGAKTSEASSDNQSQKVSGAESINNQGQSDPVNTPPKASSRKTILNDIQKIGAASVISGDDAPVD